MEWGLYRCTETLLERDSGRNNEKLRLLILAKHQC